MIAQTVFPLCAHCGELVFDAAFARFSDDGPLHRACLEPYETARLARAAAAEINSMVICMMDDCTWYVGPSLDACIATYRDEVTDDAPEEEPFVLDDDALDTLKFTESDEGERPTGVVRTFREQLVIEVAAGGTFPRLFACMDY